MKFHTLVIAAVLFVTPAFAAEQQPEKTITITVNEADLAVISEGLNELPAKRANPLFVKLNEQIKAQAAAREAAKTDAKP